MRTKTLTRALTLALALCAAGCDPVSSEPCRVHENQNDTTIVKDCGVKVGKLGEP